MAKKFEEMSVAEVAAQAMEWFPNNNTQQLLHIARHASMTALDCHSPRIIPINIVGEGGYGKTSSVKEYIEIVNEREGYKKGDDDHVGFVKRTVGGLIDIESLTGHQTVDPVTQRTILATPAWFPENPNSTGILLLDDYNRGVKHVIQGLMDLINEGSINDLRLPKRWTIVLTSNPEDGDYEVTAMDYAQKTRTINVAYSRREEELKRQASKQQLHDDIATAIYKFVEDYPEFVACKEPTLVKPKVNDRLLFLYARLYPYLKLMPLLGEMVRESTFETQFITAFNEVLASEQPVSVRDVLNNIKQVEDKIETYTKRGRFDLLNITVDRVLLDVGERSCSKDELKNLQRFLEILPEEKQFYLVGKLVHGKMQKQFLPVVNPKILQQMAALNNAVRERSKAS